MATTHQNVFGEHGEHGLVVVDALGLRRYSVEVSPATEIVKGLDVGAAPTYGVRPSQYVPNRLAVLPQRTCEAWQVEAIEEMYELIKAADGRTLLLFTSNADLNAAHRSLARRIKHTVLKQGDAPNKVLAEQFQSDEHSVLFATRSFFTGIDIESEPCLVPGTLVRTADGYKRIEEIHAGDRVWTHTGRYRKVVAVVSRRYEGDLVVVFPRNSDPIRIAADHRVLGLVGRGVGVRGPRGRPDRTMVKLRWRDASEVSRDDWLALPIGDLYKQTLKPPGQAWKSGICAHPEVVRSRSGRRARSSGS